MRRSVILILALALVVAACSRGDDTELTTTTTDSSVLQTTSTTVSGNGTDGETTTTVAGTEPPEYEIIAGSTGEGEYVVLIDPGTYTEQDLRNLMVGFVDDYAPVTAHLIDSEDARELVLLDQVTEAEQAILDAHYFARIVDGITLEFLGPYADLEPVYIGS